MKRMWFALLLALAPTAARAQDMPLSQILIDGEGWKKVEKPGPPRHSAALVISPDGSTAYYAQRGERFLLATHARNGEVSGGILRPYAPLRTKRGETSIAVGGLATDRDGRIYAATEIGVQVFDPTGRLCGVLAPAALGVPYGMGFEGDRLTMWIGDTKYARKLNTAGAK